MTYKRSEFIKQINIKIEDNIADLSTVNIPEEIIVYPSTANVPEETIAGPSTANVPEETIAGPSKRANPMDISSIMNNPSNTSPILSQIDPQV
ncbi:hypothetical protein GCM10027600_06540 [Nocardioides ginsengisegetis]